MTQHSVWGFCYFSSHTLLKSQQAFGWWLGLWESWSHSVLSGSCQWLAFLKSLALLFGGTLYFVPFYVCGARGFHPPCLACLWTLSVLEETCPSMQQMSHLHCSLHWPPFALALVDGINDALYSFVHVPYCTKHMALCPAVWGLHPGYECTLQDTVTSGLYWNTSAPCFYFHSKIYAQLF